MTVFMFSQILSNSLILFVGEMLPCQSFSCSQRPPLEARSAPRPSQQPASQKTRCAVLASYGLLSTKRTRPVPVARPPARQFMKPVALSNYWKHNTRYLFQAMWLFFNARNVARNVFLKTTVDGRNPAPVWAYLTIRYDFYPRTPCSMLCSQALRAGAGFQSFNFFAFVTNISYQC